MPAQKKYMQGKALPGGRLWRKFVRSEVMQNTFKNLTGNGTMVKVNFNEGVLQMKIELAAYNPAWKIQFQQHKRKLENCFKNADIKIEHIGSTSVEGLSAKPIIDILIGVPDEEDLPDVVSALSGEPYIYKKVYDQALPFRRFFIGVREDVLDLYPNPVEVEGLTVAREHRIAHIHAVPVTHQWWEDHLLFRDHLRANPDDLNYYEETKIVLSEKEWESGNDYASAKSDCVMHILNKAKQLKTNQEEVSE